MEAGLAEPVDRRPSVRVMSRRHVSPKRCDRIRCGVTTLDADGRCLDAQVRSLMGGRSHADSRHMVDLVDEGALARCLTPEPETLWKGTPAVAGPRTRDRAHDRADSCVLHTAPVADESRPSDLRHVQILPRIATVAGFDLGSGIPMNGVMPEEAGEQRAAKTSEATGQPPPAANAT